MKQIGLVFIAVGISLFFFFVYSFFNKKPEFHSPIPETQGVKVIYLSPAANP